jgi:hypothetical protein
MKKDKEIEFIISNANSMSIEEISEKLNIPKKGILIIIKSFKYQLRKRITIQNENAYERINGKYNWKNPTSEIGEKIEKKLKELFPNY